MTRGRLDARFLAQSDLVAAFGLSIVAAVVVWAVVSPMFAAEFGVIDDYQIASVLMPSHRLEPAAILPTLSTWLQHDVARFRPLRWTFWVTEAAIWGWNPAGWYLDRLLLAGVTVISTALLAARYAARPIAVVAGILVFVGLQSEAWYRLGTQETYGVPLLMSSLALVAWGRVRLGLLLAVLAALTKEAFVPMAALTVGWTFYLGHRRGALLGGLAVAAVGLAVLATWLSAGEPLQQTRSLLAIGSELKWMAWESAVVTLWPLFAVALAVLDWRLAVITLSIAASIVLPQAILDVGGREGRYMLPAALGAVLITSMGLGRLTSRSRRLAVVATLALLVTTVSAATAQSRSAEKRATDSRDFQAGVSGVREALASRPGSVLLVRPTDVFDFEPLISFRAYLPYGTAVFIPPPQPPNLQGYALVLQNSMVEASAAGGLGYQAWSDPSYCVAADFHVPLPPVCEVAITITGWDTR